MRGLACLWVGVVLAITVSEALAQSSDAPSPATRAETLKLARQEKQKSMTPYEPNSLERAMYIAEERIVPLLGRDGFHWKLGSLTTGSGFAFGGGYRNRRLFNREGALNIWAAASLKSYWAVEARLDFPDLAGGRMLAAAYTRKHSYPQEDFFGVGPDARRDDHTSFKLENTIAGGRFGVKPVSKLTIGGVGEFVRAEIGAGRNRNVPTIRERFAELDTPGLAPSADFLRTTAFLDFDYRQPRNARRGGWYRLEASRFGERSDALTFYRVEADLRQYASILAERRVFAVRLFLSTSDPAPGARVPFYLMPALGGHDSMRGFRDYRFRGPHAILTQTEYRWEIWSAFDAVLFYDAGKVALRRGDLGFTRLEDAYGFGFRFNTDEAVIMRVEAGFGSRDGKHLYIVFGNVF